MGYLHFYIISNSLPDSVIDADTINTFKSRLDKHWLDQDVVYNFHPDSTGSGGASIGNKSASMQLAQCRFPWLAISSAKILIYFK